MNRASGTTFQKRSHLAWWGLMLVAGCASSDPFKRAVAPPPPVQIEAGSTFTLLVPLTFSDDADTLYFQDSQRVSAAAIDRNLPYCALTPAQPTSPRVVTPRTFAVVSVEYDDRENPASGQVANVTRIALAANPTQPYTMSCRGPQGGPSQSFLTSEQIEGAIGSHFTMALQR